MEQEPPLEPKVWCGALAAYNEGHLHGEWLHAAVEPEELWEGVNKVLRTSPVPNEEEFGWFDYEQFAGIRIHEYDSVERVSKLGRFVLEHGEGFARWFNYDVRDDLEDIEELYQEAYIGHFGSEEEIGQHLADELGAEFYLDEAKKLMLPEWMHLYTEFDADSYLHDLQCGGDLIVVEAEHGVYAYWSR